MIQEGEGHWPNSSKKIAKSEEFVGVAHSAEQHFELELELIQTHK